MSSGPRTVKDRLRAIELRQEEILSLLKFVQFAIGDLPRKLRDEQTGADIEALLKRLRAERHDCRQ